MSEDVVGEVVGFAKFGPFSLGVGGGVAGPESRLGRKGRKPCFEGSCHGPWDDADTVGFAFYFQAVGVKNGFAGAKGCVETCRFA